MKSAGLTLGLSPVLFLLLAGAGLAQSEPFATTLASRPSVVSTPAYTVPARPGPLAVPPVVYDGVGQAPWPQWDPYGTPSPQVADWGVAPPGGWLEGASLFFAGDAWSNKPDDDWNNNFGSRAGFNLGLGLGVLPIRGQIGFSYGVYDLHGRGLIDEQSRETQLFVSTGVYKRSNVWGGERFSYGVVWDLMSGHNFGQGASEITLHQLRGRAGYALSSSSEVGAWMAFRLVHDDISTWWREVPVHAMDQVNFYWQQNWPMGADTMAYIGWADEPGDVVLGFRAHAPLGSRAALFGGVHYAMPSTSAGNWANNQVANSYSEETWNVSFGIVFYPGAKAISRTVSGHVELPLLPVADNGTFAVEAPNGDL